MTIHKDILACGVISGLITATSIAGLAAGLMPTSMTGLPLAIVQSDLVLASSIVMMGGIVCCLMSVIAAGDRDNRNKGINKDFQKQTI